MSKHATVIEKMTRGFLARTNFQKEKVRRFIFEHIFKHNVDCVKTLIFYLHPAWQQARAAAEAEAKRIAEEERARQEVLRIQQEEEAKRKAQEEVRLTSYFPYLWMLSVFAPLFNQ